MENQWWRWLQPGMRIKRWLLAAVGGFLLLLAGFLLAFDQQTIRSIDWLRTGFEGFLRDTVASSNPMAARITVGAEMMLVGTAIALFSLGVLTRRLVRAANPRLSDRKMANHFLRQYALARGPRVVVVGGGTGLSTLLRGLKYLTSNITAIVTVTDDGGHSGQLIGQLGILPPGDIRNCLVALSDAEDSLQRLFQHRFENLPTLHGHSFGNLFIAAMVGITGGFEQAIRKTSDVLAIRGRVLPSTLQHVSLRAEMEDGSILNGETAIVASSLRIRKIQLNPPDAAPLEDALQEIRQADIIILGPGSVYTSVIPNLLVEPLAQQLLASKAVRVYVCNVMTQPGETDGYAASDHLKAIEAHVGKRIVDYVILNKQLPGERLMGKYRTMGQQLVEADTDRLRQMGYRPVTGNFISETDVVRHDPTRLAQAILGLLR